MTRAALLALGLGALAAAGPALGGQRPGSTVTRLFTPVDVSADLSPLPQPERAALARIIDAARVMDALFLEQVWAGNPSLLLELQSDRSARGRAQLAFFLVNKGPWSRVEENRAFVEGVPPKPDGAAYYPPDATRDEIAVLGRRAVRGGSDGRHRLLHCDPPRSGRRAAGGSVQPGVPGAAGRGRVEHLRAAAELTEEPTLARYLRTRARRVRVERVLRKRRRLDGA